MPSKIDKDIVLNRLQSKFPNYIFNMELYKNTHSKIVVTCPKHGESYKLVKNLLKGHGCLKCGNEVSSNKQKLDFNEVIKVFKKVHKNKYDYSRFKYYNNRIPSIIICPYHGEFKQSIRTHSLGHGCPVCSGNKKLLNDDFISRSNSIHNNKYDYSDSFYQNMHKKVKIKCKKHGIFEQLPLHHIRGVGCPKCNQSKGELMIENFLKENRIDYITQKKFDDCFYIGKLAFDFYLPDYKTCIEFNGIQHYYPIDIFGGDEALKINKIRDKVKIDFCLKNGLKLIIIKQDKKHINVEDVKSQINNIMKIIKESSVLDFHSFKNLVNLNSFKF
jgi:very-short-patch-repair endonuclease